MVSAILDVAIGLVFVFLMTSLLCSALQEAVSGLVARRQKNLRAAIESFLTGQEIVSADGTVSSLADSVKSHPLIKRLSKKADGFPSYIPASIFVEALVDRLSSPGAMENISPKALVENMPNGEVKDILRAMLRDLKDDVTHVRARLEDWFDDYMDRVAGWYKRWTQLYLFLWGVGVAIAFDIDILEIGKALWNDPTLRALLVEQAQAQAQAQAMQGLSQEQMTEDIRSRMNNLNVPLGPPIWEQGISCAEFFRHLPGWLLAGFAASFGAPFWYNGLQRLLNIRNSGAKPPRADEKRREDVQPRVMEPGSGGSVQAGPASAFETTLTEDDIRDAQVALGLSGVALTGKLDELTRDAIRKFQSAKGQSPTGMLTSVLLRLMLDE